MKKNIILIVAIALVGTVTLTLNSLRAQNAAAPTTPPAGQTPPVHPMPPPGARGRQGSNYRGLAMMLRRAKADLEHSKEDYNGHRQTAMDACDKAAQELEAVQAAIMAEQAAAKAAAQQAPSPAPAPAPAPAPNQ